MIASIVIRALLFIAAASFIAAAVPEEAAKNPKFIIGLVIMFVLHLRPE